jgi:biotin carboxylase
MSAERRVLIVAATTGYQIRSFGEAAQKLAVRLVFASDRCDQLEDPWWDRAIPIRFHDPEASTRRIVDGLRDGGADGVIAVGDRPTVLAAHAAAALALPGNPPSAAGRSRNKLAAREAFRAAGLPVPSFERVGMDDDAHVLARRCRYPAVLKPLALSGSRGVMRVDDQAQFIASFERLRQLLHAPDIRLERDPAHDHILIESFVRGGEFAVEGVLTHGAFHAFAIFDKPDPLDGPFFEETIYVTPSRAAAATQAAIVSNVAAAARALGLHHGPVHAECRVNDAGVFVLEVAARPIGGLCSKALRFAGGASLEEVLLRHALGDDVGAIAREPQASGVMMIPIPSPARAVEAHSPHEAGSAHGVYRGVDGVDAARSVPLIDAVRITAKEGATLIPLPEGRSYLGFIFARGEDAGAVEAALREAHGRLRFRVEKAIPVVGP